MRRIDGQHVGAGVDKLFCALQKIARCANGPAHAQAALFIFAGVGVFQFLLDVLDRDQALEVVLIVDHEKLFDAMLMQNQFRLFKRGAHRDRDQVLLGHHVAHRHIGARFKAKVAVGENADELGALGDRHA